MGIDTIIIGILCAIFILVTIIINAKKKVKFDGNYIISIIMSLTMANAFYVGLGFLDKAFVLNILNQTIYESMIYNIIVGILLILLSIYFFVNLYQPEEKIIIGEGYLDNKRIN